MKWYAIHTYSGHENKVKSNLEKAINTSGLVERFGRVLVPTQLVTEMKNGKKTQSTRKYFPSYIIIEMELDEDTWHVVRNCPGVSRFVGATASKPDALRDAEVNRILGQIEGTKDKAIPEVPFHEGEHVNRGGGRGESRARQAEGDGLDLRPGNAGGAGFPTGPVGLSRGRRNPFAR
jgi:transcriptional antiterminator NusG